MIINYSNMTENPNTGSQTHWYEVKIVQLNWTSITVGVNEKGKFVSASNTFFELDQETQQKIVTAVEEMHARIF